MATSETFQGIANFENCFDTRMKRDFIIPPVAAKIKSAMSKPMKQFVFDAHASRALIELEAENPKSIIQQFSEPMPFETFCLQINIHALMERAVSFGVPIFYGHGDLLPCLNFLRTEDGDIFVASNLAIGKEHPTTWIMPFWYSQSDQTPDDNVNKALSEVIKLMHDDPVSDDVANRDRQTLFMLGTLCNNNNDITPCIDTLKTYNVKLSHWASYNFKLPILVKEMAGQFRYFFSALAILNRYRETRIVEAPACRMRIGNKWVAQRRHHSVTINLSEFRERLTRERIEASARTSPRLHDVRGHFKHYGVNPDCVHQWTDIPGAKKREHCPLCNGRRTFVPSFMRGDIERGVADTTYKVRGEISVV